MKTISIKINGENKIFESTGEFYLINILQKYKKKKYSSCVKQQNSEERRLDKNKNTKLRPTRDRYTFSWRLK